MGKDFYPGGKKRCRGRNDDREKHTATKGNSKGTVTLAGSLDGKFCRESTNRNTRSARAQVTRFFRLTNHKPPAKHLFEHVHR